jgi:hypothetical protein
VSDRRTRSRDYRGRATIPYILLPTPGARHLVWYFPKLRPGGGPATRPRDGRVAELRVHRLAIGSDPAFFVGPQRSLAGADTAIELLHRTREELGIDPANVVAVGTSAGACSALFLGMRAGCGWVIAGGAAVRMGRWLKRLTHVDGPANAAKAGAKDFLALAANGDGSPAAFLDSMIVNAARERTTPVRVDLFTSEGDGLHQDSRWLAKRLRELPGVDCRVEVGDYSPHGNVTGPFWEYARRELELAGVGI